MNDTIRFTTDRERHFPPLRKFAVGFWYVIILLGASMMTVGVLR